MNGGEFKGPRSNVTKQAGAIARTRTRVSLIAVAGLILLLGGACSKQEARWSNEPLVQEGQSTFVVEGASKKQVEALLAKNDGTRAREVYGKAGMFEVSGIGESQFRNEMQGLHVFKNVRRKFIQADYRALAPTPAPSPAPAPAPAPGPQPAVPNQPAPFQMNQCRRGLTPPRPVIQPQTFEAELNGRGILKRGAGDLVLSSASSVSPIGGAPLQFLWLVFGPNGSQYERLEAGGEQLTISPDRLGGYEVYLVVRDSRGICSGKNLQFGVTDNVAYNGPQTPPTRTAADDQKFFHLGAVKAQEAWNVTKGEGVVVAIIDTGANYNHPDLASNLAINPGEIPNNGIDDDQNGLIDDVYGYDFANGDAIPFDDQGHGTHVAGLVVGAISGVAPGAKFLPIKGLDATGSGDLASIKAAIFYASDSHAGIINMSLGSYGDPAASGEEQAAIEYAESKGALVIAASGNGKPTQVNDGSGPRMEVRGVNTDVDPNLPSAFPNANILAVAAVEENFKLSPFSNYGAQSVDLAAPGGCRENPNRNPASPRYCSGQGLGIQSLRFDNDIGPYVPMQGTSMATPIVSGVAALVKAQNPSRTFREIKQLLMDGAFVTPDLQGKMVTNGVVDAKRSLELGAAPAPSPVVP